MASPSPVDGLGGWNLPALDVSVIVFHSPWPLFLWPIMWECLDQGQGPAVCVHGGGVWAGSFHAWSQG